MLECFNLSLSFMSPALFCTACSLNIYCTACSLKIGMKFHMMCTPDCGSSNSQKGCAGEQHENGYYFSLDVGCTLSSSGSIDFRADQRQSLVQIRGKALSLCRWEQSIFVCDRYSEHSTIQERFAGEGENLRDDCSSELTPQT